MVDEKMEDEEELYGPTPPSKMMDYQESTGDVDGGGSHFILVPHGGMGRRCIQLRVGLNEVGRTRETGISDNHVSRRHLQVVVPPSDVQGEAAGDLCRVRYVGRNCKLVVVGGVKLQNQQEVEVSQGTTIVMNSNSKGNPTYRYRLERMSAAANNGGAKGGRRGGGGGGRLHGDGKRKERCRRHQRTFRKERQDKLKIEREEIFRRFESLSFAAQPKEEDISMKLKELTFG